MKKNKIPQTVLIDDEDRQKLEEYGYWYISNHGYCARTDNKNKKTIFMHRIIMNPPDDMQVDHVNGNPLDNRKSNLRVVTHQQNQFNRKNTKGFKLNKNGKYVAQITLNYKKIYLGQFNTAAEAHNAYINAKKELHKI